LHYYYYYSDELQVTQFGAKYYPYVFLFLHRFSLHIFKKKKKEEVMFTEEKKANVSTVVQKMKHVINQVIVWIGWTIMVSLGPSCIASSLWTSDDEKGIYVFWFLMIAGIVDIIFIWSHVLDIYQHVSLFIKLISSFFLFVTGFSIINECGTLAQCLIFISTIWLSPILVLYLGLVKNN